LSEQQLAEAAAELLESQPAMAPLYRAANEACRQARRRGAATETLIPAREAVPGRAAAIFPACGARVMAYSYSSTVFATLVTSRRRIARVICSEGRPGREGVRLARALARQGLRVCLCTDAALMDRLEEVDLIVVGADAFLPSGVVNKVGTRALALLGQTAGRPLFVVAGQRKVLPARLARFFSLPVRSGAEIARAVPGLAVENPYFDVTPYRLVRGVVTERGLTSPRDLEREMSAIAVSEALVTALERRLESRRASKVLLPQKMTCRRLR
ncbi:MAG: hypothetical protein ACE5JI_09025, partial [Acidobacteriota bacterium]